MANPLTGDFDAVLQVSGGTVNRLLASMHQNTDVKPALPSFPHSIALRLGDDEVIDGVQGTLEAQVSVPSIELVDRADDRFVLHVSIRARYLPDYDTERIADWIWGNVRAEYRITDIDPSCRGWRANASKYLWFRVVEESVSFHGTVENEFDPLLALDALDEAAAIEKVERQLRHLLKRRFPATPHGVSGRFRRGSMMSLAKGPRNTAVAVPLSPSGPQLGSIDQVVLEGYDFAVALSAGFVLGQVQPVLDQLRESFWQHITFHSETSLDLGPFGSPTVLTVNIEYIVTLTSASVEWTGGGFTVRISGQAVTEKSQYNLTFDVTQSVVAFYDAGAEGIGFASGGPPTVNVNYGGPFSGDVINTAKPRIQAEVAAQVQGVLAQASFDASSQRLELGKQLRSIDDNAEVRFEDAAFSPDGIVLYGTVRLSPRRAPVVKYQKTPEGNAYTAWRSWIPGGRIDSFEWSWRWAAGSFLPSGSESIKDTFRLTRPYGATSKFGSHITTTPLPGLDGMGKVCLYLDGMQVDPVTGELVEAGGGTNCQVYSWATRVPEANGLLIPDPHDVGPVHPEHPGWGVLHLGHGGFEQPGFNTLVVHVGGELSHDTATILREGLVTCRREDAGLAVIVLLDEGQLAAARSARADELRTLETDLEAPMLVNEDLNGAWAAALAVPERLEQPAWRLLSPTGAVAWMSDEPMTAKTIATALDDHLSPSSPVVAHAQSGIDASIVGKPIVTFYDDDCPPPPVGGRGPGHHSVVFTMAGSAASDMRLAQITGERGAEGDGGAVVAIVHGAKTRDEAEGYASKFGEDVVAIPDPDGKISESAGVRYWPTSVTVDEVGLVTAVDVGVDGLERPGGRTA